MAALAAVALVGCATPLPSRGNPTRASPAPSFAAPPVTPNLERDVVVAGRRATYGLHLAPLPNLLYHLDCVSGAALCAQAPFRELWATLGLDASDEAALASWRALRHRYGGELRPTGGRSGPSPLLAGAGSFQLAERQRVAGLLARTPATYEASMALLSTPGDAHELGAIVTRFRPRFDAWWRAQGFPAGEAAFDGVARLLADPFDQTVGQALRFYEAELPPGPALDVHLVAQPATTRRLTVAFQLEGYAVVEMPATGGPEAQIDVVMHEAFHYFFNRMAPKRRAALLEGVVASDDPFAAAAFGVFDEALAATLGNGVVGRHYADPAVFARRLARDDGLDGYREASLMARALLPSIEGLLERGVTASSGEFLRAFLAAARSSYPGGKPRPLDYVHAQALVTEPRFAAPAERLCEASRAFYPYLREYPALDFEAKAFLAEHPFVSTSIFVPRAGATSAALLDALAAPPAHRAAIAALARRARGFVYALPRTPKSYAFLFVAPDAAAAGELVERFVALGAVREGALVELAGERAARE
jgi:hypothetical protein